MRLQALLLAVALLSGGASAAAARAPMVSDADDASLETPFTVRNDTQIPGKTLKPGGYTMVLKDHLTDRAILQVKNDSGKIQSTFLGVLHSGLQGTGSSGPILIPGNAGHAALRGFTFPGGGTIEFVYPKEEAAAIVGKTSVPVLAIDPASDNLKAQGGELSREDSQVVTLWSLQATRLSATQAGISAKKFSPPVTPGPASAVARAEVPTRTAATDANAGTNPANANPGNADPATRGPGRPATEIAGNRVPAMKALPRTASTLPDMLLLVVVSFGAVLGLRAGRVIQ